MTTIAMTVMVAEARVSTLTSAHQLSTGNWLEISSCTISPKRRLSAESRVKDCTTITLVSASCAVPARFEWYCSTRRCAVSVLRMTSTAKMQNRTTSVMSAIESCQFISSVMGSSTRVQMKVESCSRKNSSQTANRLSAPVIIDFMSRPECASPWKESGRASTWAK